MHVKSSEIFRDNKEAAPSLNSRIVAFNFSISGSVLKIICESFVEPVVSLPSLPAFVFSFLSLFLSVHLLQV